MHLGVARFLLVLCRARRGDEGGIHDGAAVELHAAGLQDPAHFGEELLTQFVRLKHATEFEQRRRVRYGLATQVNTHKATQAGAVVECLFAGKVGQIEPVLHEVNPQHAFQTNRRTAIAAFRIMRLDDRAQFGPRHDRVHRVEKLVAPRAFAVSLETRTLIGCHRQCLLLHPVLLSSLTQTSITPEVHKRWT